MKPQIIFITSYPPRECGLATYSQDLLAALQIKFGHSFGIQICPVESNTEIHQYSSEIHQVLNTDDAASFEKLSTYINATEAIGMVMLQHEFGLFKNNEEALLSFLVAVKKPVSLVFHTVLPNPCRSQKLKVQELALAAENVVVMTNSSASILMSEYEIPQKNITVIQHGTHLVPHLSKPLLKTKYHFEGKKVLSTFGLLSSGKSIETTLQALPAIVAKHPDVLFLIIGKTHPTVVKQEGETYRQKLQAMVEKLQLQEHVLFVNKFIPLPILLEYLQLTDIYLFTSKNPAQAVSGTFAYALSSGCPIVSTPIPHAKEVLKKGAGVIVDFENPPQLAHTVNRLLANEGLRNKIGSKGLHKMAATAWENAAIAHAKLFKKMSEGHLKIIYTAPELNLDHIKKMTTNFGIIQFSIINQPDINSGYTLDDNARALIALCQHFEHTRHQTDVAYITTYFNFIKFCLQPGGYFLNYVDEQKQFTNQNNQTNLADSNGRAIWALGYLISMAALLPKTLITDAEATMQQALLNVKKIHSTRAMAFIIKGLYYRHLKQPTEQDAALIKHLANKLVQMYKHEAETDWAWFESYLTYANSLLPEALLCAWLATQEMEYKLIATSSFNFLLTKIFTAESIKVISNKCWLHKGEAINPLIIGGEQPIDIAYTIMALNKFAQAFPNMGYEQKMEVAFNWFLGNNHLNQIIYNPCTGGCYDGLEENYVNLNQGAESTVSYLMARLTIEKNKAKATQLAAHNLKNNKQEPYAPVVAIAKPIPEPMAATAY